MIKGKLVDLFFSYEYIKEHKKTLLLSFKLFFILDNGHLITFEDVILFFDNLIFLFSVGEGSVGVIKHTLFFLETLLNSPKDQYAKIIHSSDYDITIIKAILGNVKKYKPKTIVSVAQAIKLLIFSLENFRKSITDKAE